MKISLCQTIAIVCILSVGFMTAAPFLQRAEAVETHITFTLNYYQCVKVENGILVLCEEAEPWWTESSEESWWHKKFSGHPHSTIFDEVERWRTQFVQGCSDCTIS